jgi:hypothetical protein
LYVWLQAQENAIAHSENTFATMFVSLALHTLLHPKQV